MTRLTGDTRREQILSAAAKMATVPGKTYRDITRERVATKAKCSTGLISHYFEDMAGLKAALVDYAVEEGITIITEHAKVFGDA